tara:strand:- start:6025 stop:6930 length:906 start_codon:yes stop_codon:yes gene_type:complete
MHKNGLILTKASTIKPAIRWWQIFNPAIYLISILPAIVVILLAGQNEVWESGLIVATCAVVLLQHAINLFNDVSDWDRGADIEKMDSWVRLFDGDTRPVQIQAVISFVAGGVIGLAVLFLCDKLWIVFIALPLISLGYLYNAGKSPLSYSWMGEWVTGICYGGVFGGLWLVAGLQLNVSALMGIIAIAALAMSLLLSHQSPQLETDRNVGKHSFCVRYGKKKTKQVSVGLFTLSLLCIYFGVFFNSDVSKPQYAVLTIILFFSLSLLKFGPNPKRILMISSALVLGMTILSLFAQSQQVII